MVVRMAEHAALGFASGAMIGAAFRIPHAAHLRERIVDAALVGAAAALFFALADGKATDPAWSVGVGAVAGAIYVTGLSLARGWVARVASGPDRDH